MNKVTSYLKNVGKSISYATVDVVTQNLIPEVSEFTDTNKELLKAVYSTVSHSKKSIKYGTKLAKESQIFKDINKGIDNAISDIKTGNFYNKQRAQASYDDAGYAMAGGFDDLEDFDFNFDDWDDDDGSLDDFDDKKPTVDKGDLIIAESVAKSSNLSTQLISKTVANTSSNIIKANIATTNMTMAQNVELVAGIRTSIAGVHESINSILKLAKDTMPTQVNNQSQYFSDSINIMKENNAILKEMLEMQRNLYKKEVEEDSSRSQYDDVFYGGTLDITEYFKAIKKNIKNLDKTGSVGMMFADMGGTSLLGQALSNPFGAVMTGLVKSVMPATVTKQIASFSKTLGSIFPVMITRLNKWKKEGKTGIYGILSEIFGLSTDNKKSVDTSKYNKKAVPFDGITRKAIVDVIPEHLSRIEALLSGTSQRIYDYHSGKWMNVKDIKKKERESYEYNVRDSFSEISDEIKLFIKTLEKEKVLDANKRKTLDEDIFKMMEKTYQNGGWFSPEDIKKNIDEYQFSDERIMNALLDGLSKVSNSKLATIATDTVYNQSRASNEKREIEKDGDHIYRKLYDNSYIEDVVETIINKSKNKEQKSNQKNNNNYDKDKEYNKNNYDPNASLDDALLTATALVETQYKYSNLDEEKFKGVGYLYKDENKWQKEMKNIPGGTFLEKFQSAQNVREKYALIMGSLSDIAKKPASILSGMISSAESSIYNFLFKAETDEFDDEGKKVNGFFPAMLNKMRSSWDLLTSKIDEKIITPLVEKFGLDEKWNNIKEKFKNSRPMDYLRNVKNSVKIALKKDFKDIYGYTKDSVEDVLSPFIYDKGVSEGRISSIKKRVSKDKSKREAELLNIIEGKSKEEIELIKSKLSKEDLNTLKNLGFAEPGSGYVEKPGLVPVSAGEKITVERENGSTISEDKENELNTIIEALKNLASGRRDMLNKNFAKVRKINRKTRKANSTILSDAVSDVGDTIKEFTGEVLGLGKTSEEQEENIKKEQSKLRTTVGNIIGDMKGLGASTVSKAIIGGGLGLLSGVVGGPLIGAGLGAAINLAKNNDTINKILFGEEASEENGNVEKPGLISKKIQNVFKKYVPDMGKFGVTGAVASFLLPFGPLVGAALGAGVGLAKNSQTMNDMIFGEEGGLLNKKRREKIKDYLPKAAIGATAGLFLGPFGMLGNAALGAGVGMLTGTEDFRDLILGEKDENGKRTGGIKGALDEHFIQPLKDFGTNFKDDFFGFIKESMIDPLNNAITPIASEISFQTKRVVFGIPKWFLNLGKDYIAVPIMNKLNDTVFEPIAKGIKGIFGGIFSKVKGLISLPFRAVGGLGNMARKHQIKQGRDVVGFAKDRLNFANDKGLGDYKYREFDEKLSEKSEDEEYLRELSARTGMLAHGSEYFDKEVKKARRELSKVVSDYYKLGWFSKDKKSYKRIRQYIHDNDIESAIEELTNIKESRTTGGPLDAEASDAIARFTTANKKYQVARDNRDKFGQINAEENEAWMEQEFGPNWRKLKASRLFDYSTKELRHLNSKANITKNDLFKDPRTLITEGDKQIKEVLDKIYALLSGKEYFESAADNDKYDQEVSAGRKKSFKNIYANKDKLRNKLNAANIGFKDEENIVDLLYANESILGLILVASAKGINYDDETVAKLCGMKLNDKEIKLLKKYPYVATLPEKDIKKNLNHIRNNHATVFSNRLFGAKNIRNNNLKNINDELKEKYNTENGVEESTTNTNIHANTALALRTSKNVQYTSTSNGLIKLVETKDGDLAPDVTDAETKQTLALQNEEKQAKKTFMSTITGIKDGIFGIFNRGKEKDEEEKKEPWYKKLFGADLGEFGSKIKFGALLLGGFSLLGVIKDLWDNRSEGGVVDTVGTAVGNAVNPVITKVYNWISNQGEYTAADKGLSGFLDEHVFPNLFNGMNIFFGTVMPAVVTAFINNIPNLVKGALRGVGYLFGWDEKNKNEITRVTTADFKVNGKNVNGDSKSSGWLGKLRQDSTNTANTITSIQTDDNGNISNTNTNTGTDTSSGNTGGGNNAANTLLTNANTNQSGGNTGSGNSEDENEPVTIDGIGVLYKKTKNGLTPITMSDLPVKEFWNEKGNGHWVYDESSKSFVIDSGTSTAGGSDELPKRLGEAAIRGAITGRAPGILRGASGKLLKGFDKVMSSKANPLSGAYKLFSAPVKGVGWTINKAAEAGAKVNSKISEKIGSTKLGKAFNLFKNEVNWNNYVDEFGDLSSKIPKKGLSAPDVGNVAANAAKSDAGYKAKLLEKVMEFFKSVVNKILGDGTVGRKIKAAIEECGTKKPFKKVIAEISEKLIKMAAKRLPKFASSAIIKLAGWIGSGFILLALTIAADFTVGVDKAEAILGITEPTEVQKLIAGLANVIAKDAFFGMVETSTMVNWIIDWIFPIFNIDLKEFKTKRQEAQDEVDAYNLANGDNLTKQEYLEQKYSTTGKIKSVFDKGIKGAKNLGSKALGGIKSVGSKISGGVKSLASGFTDDDKIKKILGVEDSDKKVRFRDRIVGGIGNLTGSKDIAYGIESIFDIGDSVGKAIEKPWKNIVNNSKNAMEVLEKRFDKQWKSLKEGASNAFKSANEKLGSLLGCTDDQGNPISLSEGMKQDTKKMIKKLSSYWSGVKDNAENAWNVLSEKATEQWKKLQKGFEHGVSWLDTQFGAILGLEDGNGNILSLSEAASKTAKAMGKSLSDWWTSFKTEAKSFGQSVKDFFKNNFTDRGKENVEDYYGSGTDISGKGTGTDNGFVSQLDPRYKNKKFNIAQDTENQTIGDSGCAPATAANVINLYAGTGNVMNNASKAALKYKDKNSGVTPDYFQDYLGGKGINTYSTTNKQDLVNNIAQGNPTILLGRDSKRKEKTPYGPASSHYVLATGLDGRGNVIIQDPESKKPNALYSAKEVIKKSKLGIVTGRGNVFTEIAKSASKYYDDKLLSLFGIDPTSGISESPLISVDTSSAMINTGINNTQYNYSGQVTGSASDVIRVAQSQIGYKAGPNKENKYANALGKGGHGYGWCAYFVKWVFDQAGCGKLYCGGELIGKPETAYEWYKRRNLLVDKMQGQPGDIMFVYPDRHHIAIIEKNLGNGKYITIDGNTRGGNGQVARNTRRLQNVGGIARPYTLAASGTNVSINKYNDLAGRGSLMDNAAAAALKYKDKNSGVTPEYFEDYLGRRGIDTYSTTDKKEIVDSIKSGQPTILLGQNQNGMQNTPYGTTSSHYVLATGLDNSGNVIVQDPESKYPDQVYPAKDVINQSQLGMVTNKRSGRGKGRKTRRFSQVKNNIRTKGNITGAGKEDVARKVWATLRGAGFSEVQVAGVMGNIEHESGFSPSIVERSNGVGFGLCQWSYGRRTKLESYARKMGKSPSNLDIQLQFLIGEMTKGSSKPAKGYASYSFSKSSTSYDGKSYPADAFEKATDIETATKAFCYCWERPAAWAARISSRIKSAKSYYKKYTGMDPASVSTTDTSGDTTQQTSSNNIFSAITNAALDYYDDKLLSLFGFNGQETTATTTTESDSSSDSTTAGTYSGGGFAWPVPGHTTVTSGYGWRNCPYHGREHHSGIDIGAPSGSKIVAAADGKVVSSRYEGGYGNCIIIDHGNKLYTLYGHCSSLIAKSGDAVKKGQKIAKVGSTGNSTGPHLHFEVRKGSNSSKNHVSPWNYLKKPGKGTSGKGTGKVKRLINTAGKGVKKSNNMAAITSSKMKDGIYIDPATGHPFQKKGNMYIDPATGKKILKEKNGIISVIKNNDSISKVLSDNPDVNALSGTGTKSNNSMILTKLNSSHFRKSSKLLGTGKSFSIDSSKSTGFSLPDLSSTYTSDTTDIMNYSYNTGYNKSNTTSKTDRLLVVIIEVLKTIANNSEKLSEIVSLLSKALDLNLTNDDISKLSSNNAKIKNKIANALKAQGSVNGMGNSVMNSSTESLANAMYSIARA